MLDIFEQIDSSSESDVKQTKSCKNIPKMSVFKRIFTVQKFGNTLTKYDTGAVD